jgi:hypothetical protein
MILFYTSWVAQEPGGISMRVVIKGLTAVALFVAPSIAAAGYATFDQHTDTILVNGHTVLGTAATYEAIIRPGAAPGGNVWGELTVFAEDKQLGLDSAGGVYAYSHVVSPGTVIQGGSASSGAWHHYAYVFDGAQERIYIDGALVTSRAATGNIGDSPSGQGMAIGRQNRSGSVFNDGFVGDIDTLRVSTVARYTGANFTAPAGDFVNDAATAVLFNFNEAPGSLTATDESSNGFVGTLGANGTSPTFVPEPAVAGTLSVAAFVLGHARRRRS